MLYAVSVAGTGTPASSSLEQLGWIDAPLGRGDQKAVHRPASTGEPLITSFEFETYRLIYSVDQYLILDKGISYLPHNFLECIDLQPHMFLRAHSCCCHSFLCHFTAVSSHWLYRIFEGFIIMLFWTDIKRRAERVSCWGCTNGNEWKLKAKNYGSHRGSRPKHDRSVILDANVCMYRTR